MILLWALVSLPLTSVGFIVGRSRNAEHKHPVAPAKTMAIPRRSPAEKAWFLKQPALMLIGGALPFGSIFIEMYFLLASFWAYKFYYLFSVASLLL